MEAAKLNNARREEAHRLAEADEASFQKREMQALVKRREEGAARRYMDTEREKNRMRKLGAQGGREWDEGKETQEAGNGRGNGSFYRRGVHIAVAADVSRQANAVANPARQGYEGGRGSGRGRGGNPENRDVSYEARGDHRGGFDRGRNRGGRAHDHGHGRGRGDGRGRDPKPAQLDKEKDFPALAALNRGATKPVSEDGKPITAAERVLKGGLLNRKDYGKPALKRTTPPPTVAATTTTTTTTTVTANVKPKPTPKVVAPLVVGGKAEVATAAAPGGLKSPVEDQTSWADQVDANAGTLG